MPLVPQGPFTVSSSDETIIDLLLDLFVQPRNAVYKWSKITGQTAQVRLAYIGQHLASVVTGVRGKGTAARGDDLEDGSEVKTCSRADQLGDCSQCGAGVLASLDACPQCGSAKIDRKTDSHWIFAIKTQEEVELLLKRVPRVVLVLFDRVEGLAGVQLRVWEIWPQSERHRHFTTFILDYYQNNYLRKKEQGLSAAPCNLHPLKYDFYLMNPIPIFRATIRETEEGAAVSIELQVSPQADREKLPSELMPTRVCNPKEFEQLVQAVSAESLLSQVPKKDRNEARRLIAAVQAGGGLGALTRARALVPFVDESARSTLAMRIKRIKETPATYRRR